MGLIRNNTSKILSFSTTVFLVLSFTLNASNIYQTTTDLNVRSGPSSKYNSIGVILKGENVFVLDESNSQWFKIDYNGKNAFVSSKFLTHYYKYHSTS